MIFTADEIRARLGPVMEKNMVKRAVLFGSYSKGTATELSDVDIMVDSNLRGLDFFGFVEDIRASLAGKDVDVIDVAEIMPNSPIEKEINATGVEIYAK